MVVLDACLAGGVEMSRIDGVSLRGCFLGLVGGGGVAWSVDGCVVDGLVRRKFCWWGVIRWVESMGSLLTVAMGRTIMR